MRNISELLRICSQFNDHLTDDSDNSCGICHAVRAAYDFGLITIDEHEIVTDYIMRKVPGNVVKEFWDNLINELKEKEMSRFKIGDRVKGFDDCTGIIESLHDSSGVYTWWIWIKWDSGIFEGMTKWDAEKRLTLIEPVAQNWYETEEGQEWLSNHPSIEGQFEDSKSHNITVGQRYIFNDIDYPTMNSEYILVSAGENDVALIGLSNGNRYVNSVSVSSVFNISKDEWDKITGGDAKNFTLKTEN